MLGPRSLGRRLALRRRELALLVVAALCFAGLHYYYCSFDREMARYAAARAAPHPRRAHDEGSLVLAHAAADAVARRRHDGASQAVDARVAVELEAVAAHVRTRNRTKAVICCISRDDFFGLGVNRAQVEDLGVFFADYRVIVVENDSSEPFREELRAWAESNAKVRVLSKTFNLAKRPNLAFLAKMRNFYIDELRRPEYADFGRVVVFDMDVSHRWPLLAMAASSMLPYPRFGARCFHVYNDGFVHRDVLAFRSLAFAPDYRLAKVPDVVELGTMHHIYRLSKDWHAAGFSPDVDSCFGGIAAYAREALLECRYDETLDECEHLPLNRCIQEHGRSIVLDTRVAIPFHYRTVVDGLLLRLLFSSCLPLSAAAFALGALRPFLTYPLVTHLLASAAPAAAAAASRSTSCQQAGNRDGIFLGSLAAVRATHVSLRGVLRMCATGLVAQAWFVALAKDNGNTGPWLCVAYAAALEAVSTETVLHVARCLGWSAFVSCYES